MDLNGIQERAFNVAASMPEDLWSAIQYRLDHLLETGASFDPARASIDQLLSQDKLVESLSQRPIWS